MYGIYLVTTLPYSSDLSINNMGQITGTADWSTGGTGSTDYTITVRIDDQHGGQAMYHLFESE